MDESKKKPLPDIEGDFKLDTDLPDNPLSKIEARPQPEKIIIVERIVEIHTQTIIEKPVERIVYKDSSRQLNDDGLKPGQSWCGPIVFTLAIGIILLITTLMILNK